MIEPANSETRKEVEMRVVGYLATGTGLAVLAIAAAVVVQSLPDIRRYLEIRAM